MDSAKIISIHLGYSTTMDRAGKASLSPKEIFVEVFGLPLFFKGPLTALPVILHAQVLTLFAKGKKGTFFPKPIGILIFAKPFYQGEARPEKKFLLMKMDRVVPTDNKGF